MSVLHDGGSIVLTQIPPSQGSASTTLLDPRGSYVTELLTFFRKPG